MRKCSTSSTVLVAGPVYRVRQGMPVAVPAPDAIEHSTSGPEFQLPDVCAFARRMLSSSGSTATIASDKPRLTPLHQIDFAPYRHKSFFRITRLFFVEIEIGTRFDREGRERKAENAKSKGATVVFVYADTAAAKLAYLAAGGGCVVLVYSSDELSRYTEKGLVPIRSKIDLM